MISSSINPYTGLHVDESNGASAAAAKVDDERHQQLTHAHDCGEPATIRGKTAFEVLAHGPKY